MTAFTSYQDCLRVVMILSKDYSPLDLIKIRQAINVCDSLYDEKEKIWRLSRTVNDLLWNTPEAVTLGFATYLIMKSKEIRNMLQYHDLNCRGDKGCSVCKTIKSQVDLLCGDY